MLYRALVAAAALLWATTSISADEPKAPPPSPVSPVVHIEGCTGFHLGNGMVATAGHCITKLAFYDVVLEDGTKLKGSLMLYSNTILGGDDMAVIKITPPAHLKELDLWCGPTPPAGTNVHMIGYPGFYGLAEVWGKIAGGKQVYESYWPRGAFKVNISAFGGFSGSPVMATGSDLVLGILVGGLNGQMDLALAVPAYRLCDLIGKEFLP
jgi:V8-like Glu-specific endopeptidase